MTGCSQENQNSNDKKQNNSKINYGTELLENGFLKFADTLKLDSLKLELIGSFNIYDESNNKIAHIDAEELAEFSFDFFLPHLNRILAKRGFHLNVKPANDIETSNDIFINEEKIKLYTKEEVDNETFWESASRIFFKEVNKQLNKKGIEESFYLLYSGNDLHVLLLTVNQHRIISDNYKQEPKEIPYLP
jgi:hypothetical protein